MAAPNLVNVSTINALANAVEVGTSLSETLLNNAAGSGLLKKVESIVVANKNTTADVLVTVAYHNQDDGGGTAFEIASTITVPANSSLVVLDKNSPLHLEEDRSLVVTADSAGDIVARVDYLEINDS